MAVVIDNRDKGWELEAKDHVISLNPSIKNNWCGSHYYITDNKIIWVI